MDLSSLPIIDGHAHPLLVNPWAVSPETFLDLLSEGRPGTMRQHVPHTGYFRRVVAGLARGLGVDPTVEAVLEARARTNPSVGTFSKAGIEALLIDTGYPVEAMPLHAMRALLPCQVHEIFRIERCAEGLFEHALPYDDFIRRFTVELEAAAARCAAFKTIVAYRSGLAIRPWPQIEAVRAYEGILWRVGREPVRLTSKPLLDTLVMIALDVARRTGRPVQVHSGFGDPDIDLLAANPLLLRPILEDQEWRDVKLVLLHMSYPYAREAAFMTAVWPQVHLDLSLALPFLGPGAVTPLADVLALAPASKLMYGSDLSALPELYALAAEWGRAALAEALQHQVDRGGLTQEQALADAALILAGNARALYRLA